MLRLLSLALSLSIATAVTAQGTITLRSGNAAAGLPDPQITYLQGPATSGFGVPFNSGDFAAARSGSQALVRPSLAGWPLQLPADPLAQWIDTNGGSTSALYAIPFTFTPGASTAVLRMQLSVDDHLGEVGIAGAYINEIPLANTENIGGYYYVESYANGEVLAHLQPGQNWLYLYTINTGGAGGLLFSAEIVPDGGMIQRFGSGCTGSNGTPLYLAAATSTAPGSQVDLRLYNLPLTPAPVVFVFGVDASMCFGQPTPYDLTLFGFPGCSCLVEPIGSAFGQNALGAANLMFSLPGAGFVGQSIYTQAFVFDPTSARGASVSGGIELRAGN